MQQLDQTRPRLHHAASLDRCKEEQSVSLRMLRRHELDDATPHAGAQYQALRTAHPTRNQQRQRCLHSLLSSWERSSFETGFCIRVVVSAFTSAPTIFETAELDLRTVPSNHTVQPRSHAPSKLSLILESGPSSHW